MVTTFLGYLVVAGFFWFESRLRQGQEAKSLKSGEFDQRTTMVIGVAYVICAVALWLALLLSWMKIAVLPAWVGWLGIAIALAGLGFRAWAMRVLGAFYTRTLKMAENQTIAREGPCRPIRHPGYLGSILMWTGAAAATANWIVILLVLAAVLGAYTYRIQYEEKLLLSTNANYAQYRAHTWKLIPFLY
jgi:protein-S-isoprenylcysteine O-methyltransferase Ste14